MKTCHENPGSIVAGSYHRTRDGTKVFIQAVLEPFDGENSDYPVFGAFYDNDGDIIYVNWSIEGRKDYEESILDLVSEWNEPKKIIRWMVRGEAFECFCSTEQEAILLSMKMQVVENVLSKRIMLIGYE